VRGGWTQISNPVHNAYIAIANAIAGGAMALSKRCSLEFAGTATGLATDGGFYSVMLDSLAAASLSSARSISVVSAIEPSVPKKGEACVHQTQVGPLR
jgi:hypothetical protein